MAGRLQDKVAIVTDAGSFGPGWGKGKAAVFLTSDDAGYNTGLEMVVDDGTTLVLD